MRGKLASGRGRRAAFADKVKQAVLLMLNGASADDAAAAAGFKAMSAPWPFGGHFVKSSDGGGVAAGGCAGHVQAGGMGASARRI